MRNKGGLLIRLVFMIVALVGVFYTMAYFRSGQALKDPESPVQLLLGTPSPSGEKPTADPVEPGQAPQNH